MALPTRPVSPEDPNEPKKPADMTLPVTPATAPAPNVNTPVEKGIMEIGQGLPTKPYNEEVVTAAEPTRTRTTAGRLTSEDILTKKYDTYYAPLENKILEVTRWTQNILSDNDKNNDISTARKERGKKYDEMAAFIDNVLVRYFSSEDIVRATDAPLIIASVINEILGLGPIEPLWQDGRISEIMVNGPYDIKVEIEGKIRDVPGAKFRDAEHLLNVCQQILGDIGREVNIQRPTANGRLPDGSRIHVVHQNIAPAGPFLTIRRFPDTIFTIKELVEKEAMTEEIALEIGNFIYKGCSAVIAGSTGSGKDLSLTTKIPTPTGMTTMGDLKVGDYVLDELGNPTKVLAYYPQENPEVYELTFSDGTKIIAGKDHNWLTSTRAARTAVSRQERSPEYINAAHKTFTTDKEIAALVGMYVNRAEKISPSDIFSSLPRLRTVTYNASRNLKVLERSGSKVFYNSQELLDAVLKHAEFVNDQHHKIAVESVVTTEEIFNTLKTLSGHTNHSIRMIEKAIEYETKTLTVPPYSFGAWLGDGYSHTGKICGMDKEVFANIEKEGYEIDKISYDSRPYKNKNYSIYSFKNLTKDLKTMGVLKTKGMVTESKFIPDDYLYSSVGQRKALIAGLLDTDGTVNKTTGVVQFTNSNKVLIDGFRQIIHSLGYQSTLTEKIPNYTYNGVKKQGKVSYTVSFFTNDDVFGIRRKQEIHTSSKKVKQAGHRSEFRYIMDVKPVPAVPTACITVDSPNNLYLASEAFVVTHNTSMLNALSGAIPFTERVVTIEDNLELRLNPTKHVLAMEAKQAGANGTGGITIRDLVFDTLRMRPDRIIVGEVRDAAAYDMLQAMNTGHDGSMTTVHANDAEGAIERLTNLISQVGDFSPERALSLIAGGIDIIVVVERYEDGSRRVSAIAEVPSVVKANNRLTTLEPSIIWEYKQDGVKKVEDSEGNIRDQIYGHYEKVNEISDSLIRKHRLDKKASLSLAELYELSDIPKAGPKKLS